MADKSPDKHEYHKVLDRYKANKPYYRLGPAGRNGSPDPPAGGEERRLSSRPRDLPAERNPFMSPILKRPLVGLVLAVVASSRVRSGDLAGGVKLKTFVRPKKSSCTPDRAFEYVQKAADFSLFDGQTKIAPSGVGYICLLERAQGDQLLVTIRSQGLRGWAPASALVPLNHADAYFSQQIEANPRDPFAFLMRGVVRYENDDLDRAFADVNEALRLDPKYVAALVERATSGNAAIGSTWLSPTSTRRSSSTRVILMLTWNGASFISA